METLHKHDMALHNLHGSKQSGLLSRVEHECSNENNIPIMDKFQTRRHSLHGNNIFVCKKGLLELLIIDKTRPQALDISVSPDLRHHMGRVMEF